MTLKEKFNSLVPIEFGGMQEPTLTECVQIADEFAVGFVEFQVGLLTKQVEGYFYFYYYAEWKTSKELLEIYKKTL